MRSPGEVGHPTAGFLHDQATSRDVPRAQMPLPVCIESPAGDIAQVEGCRSAPAHTAPAFEGHLDEGDIRPCALTTVVRKARAEQGVRQLVDVGGPDRAAIQLSTLAPRRTERLAAERIVHQAEDPLSLMLERDGDGAVGIPVDEVRGPVERIDVPAIVTPTRVGRRLLRDDGVVRKGAPQSLNDEQLSLTVRGGDEVDLGLVDDGMTAAIPGTDQRSGAGDRGARYPLEPPHAHALACTS